MQTRQSTYGREWPGRVQSDIPSCDFAEHLERKRRELQPLFQAACRTVNRSRLNILGVFGQIGVHQALGMFLRPAKAFADKQTLVADRNILAGHGVVGQAADIAAIT